MNQNQLIKTHFSQVIEQKHKFDELLNCQICYCKVTQPTMCPYCSKLYCQPCINKSLKLKSECPNCRKKIKGQLTNCSRFLNQLTQIVTNLVQYGEQMQRCEDHGINLNYFCQNCNKPACCQCKMFGEHQAHTFKPISLIYQQKYNKIREMLSKLKSHILEKQQDLTEIENQLIKIKADAEAQITEIDDYTEKYKTKISMEQAIQNNNQSQFAQTLVKQLEQLENLKESINAKNEQAKKSHCYKEETQLFNRIDRALLKSKQMLTVSKNTSSLEELIPPYRKFVFIVQPYQLKKQENKSICSKPMQYEGSQWRLVVYLKGNASSYQHLSVFVELISNPDNLNHYEYLVELFNPYDSKKNIVKEHQAKFQVNECWGYSKFIKNEDLQSGKFINQEKDSLQINFGIRMCYYHDLYKRREHLISQLDQKIQLQKHQIQELQLIASKKSATSFTILPNENIKLHEAG